MEGGCTWTHPPEDRDSREKLWDYWHYIYVTNSKPVATALGGLALLRFKFFSAYEVLGRAYCCHWRMPPDSPVMITPTPLRPLRPVVKRRQGCLLSLPW